KETIVIPPALAYGEFNPNAVIEVPQQQLLDANIPTAIGITVHSNQGEGKIIALDPGTKTAKIDFNHPLAGKQLTFAVEILKIDNKP
ncbi:MAG: peptidylprolyl isomerase, partial [archaeon]